MGGATDKFARGTAALVVRPTERSASLGLWSGRADPSEKHRVLDEAYANPDFCSLLRLARELIAVDTVGDVLARALDVAFETLPVHRAVIMLTNRAGELVCEIARIRDRVEHRPPIDGLVSMTIVQRTMCEGVAIVTGDATEDERFSSADSVWRRDIRAAMCVPLWSERRIIGVMQVDSPVWVRSFNERDLDLLVALGSLAAVAVERIREHNVRRRLERYHAPTIVEQLLRDEEALGEVRGVRKAEVTVLFADLVGFTSIAESVSPEEVANLLSGFCTRAAAAIFAEGGTLDKFMGDCVMAFFGAPIEAADHALQAVRSALRIDEAIDRWNGEERLPRGLPALRVRVGINSGPVVVGEIGNEHRADYTVLGNTVNVAARLEQCVADPGDIVLGDSTRRLVGDAFDLEPLGEIALHGLEHPIAGFRLRRATGPAGRET